MLKSVLASLLVLVLPLAGSPALAGDAIAQTRAAAVVVVATAGNRQAVGSGVVIASTPESIRVLTARHVAVFGDLVVRVNGSSRSAHVVYTSATHDLAVIEAAVDHFHFGALQPARLGVVQGEGAPIFVWGSGDTIDSALLRGSIEHLDPALPDGPADGRFTIACAKCAHGDSGSGIFDENGTLIGILSSAWMTANGHVVMLVAEPVADALSHLN